MIMTHLLRFYPSGQALFDCLNVVEPCLKSGNVSVGLEKKYINVNTCLISI